MQRWTVYIARCGLCIEVAFAYKRSQTLCCSIIIDFYGRMSCLGVCCNEFINDVQGSLSLMVCGSLQLECLQRRAEKTVVSMTIETQAAG